MAVWDEESVSKKERSQDTTKVELLRGKNELQMTQDTLKDVTGCLRTILESVVMEMWKCRCLKMF